MAEIQAMNMADAASAISAMLAPEKGQAELDETQPAEESARRETAWCMLQAIDGLRQELIKIMDNGKIAQNAISKSQKNLI